jgi:adenine phosphoribosyltransferase
MSAARARPLGRGLAAPATVFEAAAIIDLPELGGSQKLQDAGIPTFTLTAFALDDH